MSTSTVILNGESSSDVRVFVSDANVNMVAATKDNSCSKHLEKFNNSKENNTGVKPYLLGFDHLYASNKSDTENSTDTNTEIVHLKGLLLLHLDLIQQQSEQLVTKDKQINSLKHENNLV